MKVQKLIEILQKCQKDAEAYVWCPSIDDSEDDFDISQSRDGSQVWITSIPIGPIIVNEEIAERSSNGQ